MRKVRGGKVLGWRWQNNPLRRRSDVLEAWIVLMAWTFALIVAVVIGILGAQLAQHAAQRDRAGRTRTDAVLVRVVPGGTRDVVGGVRHDRVLATVRWRDDRGAVRTGTAEVKRALRAGSTVPVWTDGHGRLVSPPAGPGETVTRAVLVGAGAGLAAGLLVLSGGYLVRLRVERRDVERWGTEWDRTDPRRGHTTG